jgi:dUTP pyrophosphatase
MKVKFRQLHDDAVLPTYAKPGDAGLDLTTTSKGLFVGSEDLQKMWYYIEYKTGLAVEIPEGYVGLLFPRSSISKSSLSLANSVGVIDSGYRGEICLRFKVDTGLVDDATEQGGQPAGYDKGDKIGQLVIVPYPTIEPEFSTDLSETERGEGGFGSTDVKSEMPSKTVSKE